MKLTYLLFGQSSFSPTPDAGSWRCCHVMKRIPQTAALFTLRPALPLPPPERLVDTRDIETIDSELRFSNCPPSHLLCIGQTGKRVVDYATLPHICVRISASRAFECDRKGGPR